MRLNWQALCMVFVSARSRRRPDGPRNSRGSGAARTKPLPASLGNRERPRHPAAFVGGAGRGAAVHHRPAAVEIEDEAAAADMIAAAGKRDGADQGDDPPLEVVDGEAA